MGGRSLRPVGQQLAAANAAMAANNMVYTTLWTAPDFDIVTMHELANKTCDEGAASFDSLLDSVLRSHKSDGTAPAN